MPDYSLNPKSHDASGAIGLGSREVLLEELTGLDEQRARPARSHGEDLLTSGTERLRQEEVQTPSSTVQRQDYLADTLRERI